MAINGGVNHVALRVRSLQRSDKFYTGILGLKLVGKRGGMSFYSSGLYNHELALIEDSSIALENIRQSGLAHIAFNVENIRVLKFLYRALMNNNYPVSAGVDHNISRSFYTHDADGYVIELTTDCPRHEWKLNPHVFGWDKPHKL